MKKNSDDFMRLKYFHKFSFLFSPLFIFFGSYYFIMNGGPITEEGSLSKELMSSGSDDAMFGQIIIFAYIPALFIFSRSFLLRIISFILVFIIFSTITFIDFFWEASVFNFSLYPDGRLIIWITGYLFSWTILLLNFAFLIKYRNTCIK